MNKKEFLPIILGNDENAYGCARNIYDEYKIKSLILCSKKLDACDYSRILNREVIKNFDNKQVFISIMNSLLPNLKKEYKKIIMIPCSDYYTDLMVSYRDFISKYVDNPINSEEMYFKINNKISFYSLCDKYGLPYPKTIFSTPELLLKTRIPFSFPIVIKPLNSNSFSYLHSKINEKKKVYFISNYEEYFNILTNFVSEAYVEPLIVQEYIKGETETLRTVNTYSDKNGKVRLIGVAKPLIEYTDSKFIGNYAALECISDRKLCKIVIDFLEKIEYKGYANFDLKINENKNEYYFFEMNPRQGRSSYYMSLSGNNLMKEIVDDVVFDKPFEKIKYSEEDIIWTNIPYHLLSRLYENNDFHSHPKSAISYTYDFSPMRSTSLFRKNLREYLLFKDKLNNY